MEEFLRDTTIHGVEFLDTKDKVIRKSGKVVFFIAFCGLAFFMHDIYVKWQVNPQIVQELNLVPASDYPFPAVTICNPVFSRDQKPNINDILSTPLRNLSIVEQKHLAAAIQASAPELSTRLLKEYPNIDPSDTVDVLKEKYSHSNEFFKHCSLRMYNIDCERLFNYVLTDYGFCFNYNLQGFHQIFRSQTISQDFNSYRRTKIAKYYSKANAEFYDLVDDDVDLPQWTMEKEYENVSIDSQPTNALRLNQLTTNPKIKISDMSNFALERGKTFSLFLHMPNEMLTPFHEPHFSQTDTMNYIFVKLQSYKSDPDLRRYSPINRGCYFSGEKPLKYFASYSKHQCQFECLANQTLEACGCVKFSMPRDKSTPICDLNKTSCYLKIRNDWSRDELACGCLPSCTRIDYEVKYTRRDSPFQRTNQSILSRIDVRVDETVEMKMISLYTLYNVIADFGSSLGMFFGCSLLSIVELLYFLILKIFKIKSKKENSNDDDECSNNASKSSVHGFQYIFDNQRKRVVRTFWFLLFAISLVFCALNALENYDKLTIEPEIELEINQNLASDIPFPSITICSNIFAKNGLANISRSTLEITKTKRLNVSTEETKYSIANILRFSPNAVGRILQATNYSESFAIVDYLNRSEFHIHELMHDCSFGNQPFNCSDLFQRTLSSYDSYKGGFCFSFNQENFQSMFKEIVSKDFDSNEGKSPDSMWTLDEGYLTADDLTFPIRASRENDISLNLLTSKEDATNTFLSQRKFQIYLKKPNEAFHFSRPYFLKFKESKSLTISAEISTHRQEFRKFLPEHRGCYFTNEKSLKYFKSYTEDNCMKECLTNYTLDTCKCVHHSMPRNDTTRICIFAKESRCVFDVTLNFPIKSLGTPACGCLKTCNDIKYSVTKESREIKRISKNTSNLIVSQITFKFADTYVIKNKNLIGYGITDFLTDVGGVLGLFLGCSVISVIEILYCLMKFLIDRIDRIRNSE